jgi:hypothetical protein
MGEIFIIFLIIFFISLLFLLSISIGFFVFFKKKKKLLGIFFIALGLALYPFSLKVGPGRPLPYIYSIPRGACSNPSPIPFLEIPILMEEYLPTVSFLEIPILIEEYKSTQYKIEKVEEGYIPPNVICPSIGVLNIPFLLINVIFWYFVLLFLLFFLLKVKIHKMIKVLLSVVIILFVIFFLDTFIIDYLFEKYFPYIQVAP